MNRFDPIARHLNGWLNRHRLLFLAVTTAVYVLSTAGYYHAKPADPDEVVYQWIARMPSIQHIWAALLAGINIDPPLTQTGVHFLFRWFGSSLWLARLPESIGFWTLCVGAYLLVSRHAPPLFAAAGLFLPLATTVRSQSIEARPYGVMVGCAMLALLCWDRVNLGGRRHKWLAGLTLFVAACVSSHFFGALLLFPIVAGEFFKLYLRRKPDWISALAITIGASPLLLWLPIVRAGAAVYGKHYFGPLSGDVLYLFYNNVLLLSGFAFLLLLCCAVFALSRGMQLPQVSLEWPESTRLLLAVTCAFLLIPVLGYIYAVLISHFFVTKYLMLSTFGVVLGVPLAFSILSARNHIAGLLLFVAFAGHGVFVFARGASGFLRSYPPMSIADVEDVPPGTKGDLVVASAVLFETLTDAAGPESNRLLYLYDPEKAVRYSGTDSSDLVLKALNGQCPARMQSYDFYVRTHRKFYIVTAGPLNGVNEWIMTHLARTSAHLQYVKSAGMFDVFLVTLPDSAETAPL